MRWLQWSTIDLEGGMGGVEVHARSLARELRQLNIEVSFGRDLNSLSSGTKSWDVIHTHGSAVPIIPPRELKKSVNGHRPIRVHTLHGTTLGRMAACGEWTWPGGYAAAAREMSGVLAADVVLAVHPELSLFKFAKGIGREVAVCYNGWDAGVSEVPLPQEVQVSLPDEKAPWVFVGRGRDRVKAVDRIHQALRISPGVRLIAVPGEGFEQLPEVRPTGLLTPGQIRTLLDRSAGLIIGSRYEGNSLAVLEALAQGIPVLSTPVGAAPLLSGTVQGLVVAKDQSYKAIAAAWKLANQLELDPESRETRAKHNRGVLPTWKQVAQAALGAVEARRSRA